MKLNSHQLRKSRVGLPAGRQGSRLNSKQLRTSNEKKALINRDQIKRQPIVLVLDNVLDTYNIGSFFRLADALGVEKIYLCGSVVTPPNLKIHRASIGTWKWVPWEQFNKVGECLQKLKAKGFEIVACEQGENSVNYQKSKYKFPLAIVAGSEMYGISKETQKMCDQIIEVPMYGINVSMNVLVATAVIAFDAASKC
ncbi:MAG: TrmH family RNA methyltransferase [Candidatus Shapirobacteria bacterium]|jgi:tRNA G18 (ribose-2'-O)-methylase SpoU